MGNLAATDCPLFIDSGHIYRITLFRQTDSGETMRDSNYKPEDSPWVKMCFDWTELVSGFSPVCYAKGHSFFRAGEQSGNVYLIECGRVALNLTMEKRRTVTVIVLDQGGVFGDAELLDLGGLFTATVMSDEVHVYAIPKEVADKRINESDHLVRNILYESNRINRILAKQLGLTGVRDATKRVAFHLVNLANQYYIIEKNGNDEKKVLIFQFTHQELSEAAGLSREAVSKVLSMFVKEGILKKGSKHRYIVQDEEALERHALI
ncbi:MAG: Crp/Fnr family transcriptional regulator [Clostridiales bacterium]|nr:Crp/Fnr family transcriptional regulator [Clostridiales bacterium]